MYFCEQKIVETLVEFKEKDNNGSIRFRQHLWGTGD